MLRLLWCLLCLLLTGLGNRVLPCARLRSRLLVLWVLLWLNWLGWLLVHVGLLILLTCSTNATCSADCSGYSPCPGRSTSTNSSGTASPGTASSATARCGLTGEHVQVGVITV